VRVIHAVATVSVTDQDPDRLAVYVSRRYEVVAMAEIIALAVFIDVDELTLLVLFDS